MRIDARITIYRIDRCGYYPRGGDVPEFGEIASILSELQIWSEGKHLGDTRTFNPAEGHLEPTYCFDIRKTASTGDYLLTTWNEVSSEEGGMPVVDPRSTVGKASVTLAPVPGNSIPGYATYFWFIPSRNAVATVLGRGYKNGQQNLVKYVHEFMAKFTRFVVSSSPPGEDIQIEGYRQNSTESPRSLVPAFRTKMLRRKAEVDLVRENREQISHIIRKNRLNPTAAFDRTFLEKLMTGIGIYKEPPRVQPVKIRYEVAYTPSEDELENIIGTWETRADTDWDDVGFRFRGSQSIIWLSRSIVSETATLDIEITETGILGSASLLRALEAGRQEILSRF